MALTLLKGLGIDPADGPDGRARGRPRGRRAGTRPGGPAVPGRGAVRAAGGLAMSDRERLVRWRLVLGHGAEEALGCSLDGAAAGQDQALAYLYDREYGQGRNVRGAGQAGRPRRLAAHRARLDQCRAHALPQEDHRADREGRARTVPARRDGDQPRPAPPRPAEHDAAQGRPAHQAPDEPGSARPGARDGPQGGRGADGDARPADPVGLPGAVDRHRRTRHRVAKNFDAKTTIRRNLRHYDPKTRRLHLETPYFFSRIRRQADRWQVIILVDESGSMADSVIHAAVTAAIFFGIKTLRTHLCLFDTNVVDVTDQCQDPVETIMKVQLGGRDRHRRCAGLCRRAGRIPSADDRRAHHRLLRGRRRSGGCSASPRGWSRAA